jgi:hypothetical protein
VEMSKRLDDAVRRVKEMPQPFQERAIIRLQTLIREWEKSPGHEREESMRQRVRRRLQAVGRLIKRNPAEYVGTR